MTSEGVLYCSYCSGFLAPQGDEDGMLQDDDGAGAQKVGTGVAQARAGTQAGALWVWVDPRWLFNMS